MTIAVPPTQGEEVPFKLREIQPTDHPFVFGTWIRHYLDSRWARPSKHDPIPSEDYFQGQLKVIESIVARAHVLVAQHADYELLLGYAVGEIHDNRPAFHWVYVKGPFREHGIGRALEEELLQRISVKGEPVRRTHRGRAWVEGFVPPASMTDEWSRHLGKGRAPPSVRLGPGVYPVTGRDSRSWIIGLAEKRGYLWNPYCLFPPQEKKR